MAGRVSRTSGGGGPGGARPRPPDIGEIARRVGVSRSTVSYALSGKRSISEETRKRILDVVEKLNYRPNAAARALAEGRTRTLGLLFPSHASRVEAQQEVVATLSELANSQDLDLLLSPTDTADDRSLARMLSRQRVDGVLFRAPRMKDPRISALIRSGIPYVLIGSPADRSGLFWVDHDQDALVDNCVNHLADLGHRDVALVNGPAEIIGFFPPATRALAGFRAAVKRRGLRGQQFCCQACTGGGEEIMKEILAVQPRITAAVVVSEAALPGMNRALDRARIVVPRDFSITGLMSERSASEFRPQLTAAVVSWSDHARSAFELLMRRIEQPELPPQHVRFSPPITLRASTGPVPRPPRNQRRSG